MSLLLVEDNPTDEKLTVRALKKCGLSDDIQIVRDGAEALEYLTKGPLPRVVLLDLKLPRVDGIEVVRRLRALERTRCLPIVVLTASREEDDVTRVYAAGANAYGRKPVDFAEFVET